MKMQQDNTQNDLNQIVSQYLDKGWTAPLPLPHNAKFPPPKGVTGNIPPLEKAEVIQLWSCLLYTSPSPRDVEESRMPSSA